MEDAQIHDPARDLYVVPIRHHSPACAAHLTALVRAIQPATILVEGPCDFDPLIQLLSEEASVPPIAVVSIDERKTADGEAVRRAVSYFPF